MPDKDVKDMPTVSDQLPLIAGCTVIAYNIPGVQERIKGYQGT